MTVVAIPRLCGAEYLRDYKILATFEDGKAGVIDLEHELWGEEFEPLREVGLFWRFRFDAELDTIVWPTGADLAPEYLYENAVAGELRPVVESPVGQPFFPVSKVRVRATDTGHTFRRHWAVVSDDRREVFAIVTEDYQLVSNLRAYEIGRRAFALVFGEDAAVRLKLFNVTMPATRSWAHIDLTADGLEFAPIDKDRWLPFLRVTNSYNRSRALGFTVGVCRSICTNGMIFGEESLKLKVAHATDVDLERRLVEAFAHRRFDVAGCRDKLEKLTRLSVPQERFPAGMLEILDVKPPAELPRNAARRDGWLRLGRCLRGLGEKYRKDLGGNAYALVNAASEYAGDTKAPLMSPARVDALQFRCGRWVDRVLERYGPALASRPVVDFRPGSMNAAGRLAAWAAGPRQSDSCSRS